MTSKSILTDLDTWAERVPNKTLYAFPTRMVTPQTPSPTASSSNELSTSPAISSVVISSNQVSACCWPIRPGSS